MPNYINRYLRLSITPDKANEPVIFGQDWKITFRVRKCASASILSYNQAEISVYNMTSEMRNMLSTKYMPVTLDAGYESMHGIIFTGSVYNITTVKRATELITTFYCVSDTRAYENLVNECVSNITVKDLIARLCEQYGVSYSLQTTRNDVVQRSYTGVFSRIIALICYEYGISCALDNGQLIFKDKKSDEQTISSSNIKVYTPNSGILGNPTVTEIGIRFKALLQHDLQVNDYFRLEAPYAEYNLNELQRAPGMVEGGNVNALAHIDTHTYNGAYMVLNLIETGDTRGNSWYTEVEGSRIWPKQTYA